MARNGKGSDSYNGRLQTTRTSSAAELDRSHTEINDMPFDDWNSLLDYFRRHREQRLAFNDDYRSFLFFDVWRLNGKACRILDVGCGTGNLAVWMLPRFPEGTEYVGVDTAENLLSEAREMFSDAPLKMDFVQNSAYDLELQDASFDLVLTNCVLMHLERPLRAVDEMIRVTKPGGVIVSCEGSRNGWSALTHIEEVDEMANAPIGVYQRMNKAIREKTGVDYNIGMKLPVIFHQKGLRQVECRLNDRISCVLPPNLTDEMHFLFDSLCKEGWGPLDKEREARWREHLLTYGATPDEVEYMIDRFRTLDFAAKGKQYHLVYPHVLTFYRGVVPHE
jgi:ubiquinone/menaquinone biosynthesis C-methylase UbiE